MLESRLSCIVLSLAACVAAVPLMAAEMLPPAPRPWNEGSAAAAPAPGTSTAPMTEANGSRLRVTDEAVRQSQAEKQPNFRNEAPLRNSLGSTYVGAMVGLNFAQDSDLDGVDGSVNPGGGLKLGYVFPFDSEPIDQFMDETRGSGVRLAGALEVEAFYVRNEVDLGGSDFTLDVGYFMLNALLKGNIGKFTLYAGPGVGLAYSHASGGALTSDEDQASLAYQMIGGLEYAFAPDWSLFAEYKWLVADGVDVDLVGNPSADLGAFEQNLLMFGVKRSF